ncbi:MAG: hypothetical protein P8X74_11865 [Reinekea sp.]
MRLIIFSCLTLCSALSMAETHLISPEWEFSDDFEGTEDKSFWGDPAYAYYGEVCPGSDQFGKSLIFTYLKDTPAGNSWSEKRFDLPFNAVQMEFSYDLYTPSNFVRPTRNQKNFVIWSGAYGSFNANTSIASENWPVDGGSTPSVNISVDGKNFGHTMSTEKPLMMENHAGTWNRIHVFIELAKEEGDYGRVEISKDGNFLNGNNHPYAKSDSSISELSKQFEYSSRGNFLDQGYLMGWANAGFLEKTALCIDNFTMKANSTFKTTTDGPRMKDRSPVMDDNVVIEQ